MQSSFVKVCLLISLITFGTSGSAFTQDSTVVRSIELKAIAGLQYDKVQLVVKPGATIRITLVNTSEMVHNMLITRPGTRNEVVKQAESMGEQGLENDFIPQSTNILAAIPLLAPDESGSIIFQVPDREGVYPYVCTYPAHGIVMYGAMHVTANPDVVPPPEEDPNVPEPRRKEEWGPTSFHPYPTEMPQVTRLFMPGASPAAIAVGMEKEQSYCWDAGVCHLRYAWDGGYINPTEQWDAKATEFANLDGEVYYENQQGFPFRIQQQDSVSKPEFLGYRLIDGYPEFSYRVQGVTIHELIKPRERGTGVKISYTLEDVNRRTIWYEKSGQHGISVTASEGEWKGNFLKLTPEQAGKFTISITTE